MCTFKGLISVEGLDYESADTSANNTMALLNGVQPEDEIEGMLAVQMIGVHNAAMEMLKRAMIHTHQRASELAGGSRLPHVA